MLGSTGAQVSEARINAVCHRSTSLGQDCLSNVFRATGVIEQGKAHRKNAVPISYAEDLTGGNRDFQYT
jgi:hypothetical protein